LHLLRAALFFGSHRTMVLADLCFRHFVPKPPVAATMS
jgi:hypothetical protein